MTILVTGGAGFIGSNFVLDWLAGSDEPVVNLDALTYAGNPENLSNLAGDHRHCFVHGDIRDGALLARLFAEHRPRALLHFAAESHVDRSIHEPEETIQSNIVGTLRLLEAACTYWRELPADERTRFRFLQVSTDEVYGSLTADAKPFTESSPLAPNSPYAASKAAADHLVRAFHQTWGLPVLTTRCSNNYGPRQFPEKLIPLILHNALAGLPLPIYGDGQQVRDWLPVGDHCAALRRVLAAGQPGEIYNIGGNQEMSNLELVHRLCQQLDSLRPRDDGRAYREQIVFVADRPGHDRRYAIDAGKLACELDWRPRQSFDDALAQCVRWYLENQDWVRHVTSGEYRHWQFRQYGLSA